MCCFVTALVVFTGFFHFTVSPGWLSQTVICDQESGAVIDNLYTYNPDWRLQHNVTDRWECARKCQGIDRLNKFTSKQHALFRYSVQCHCAPELDELDQMFNLFPQCFNDVFLDSVNLTYSWASSAVDGGIMTTDASVTGAYAGGNRTSQLLHAKLVILRYWDVQLCRYILQVSVPASFVVICVMRIFAGLPPLQTVKSMWLPWFMTSIFLSAPVALMYLPSLLQSDAGVQGVRTVSLGGAHLYVAVLLMIPLIMLGVALWVRAPQSTQAMPIAT